MRRFICYLHSCLQALTYRHGNGVSNRCLFCFCCTRLIKRESKNIRMREERSSYYRYYRRGLARLFSHRRRPRHRQSYVQIVHHAHVPHGAAPHGLGTWVNLYTSICPSKPVQVVCDDDDETERNRLNTEQYGRKRQRLEEHGGT